jgi:hypothetical protein
VHVCAGGGGLVCRLLPGLCPYCPGYALHAGSSDEFSGHGAGFLGGLRASQRRRRIVRGCAGVLSPSGGFVGGCRSMYTLLNRC